MKMQGGKVTGVTQGGIAWELEIEPGDIITRIDGEAVTDMISYQFLCAGEDIEVEVYKKDGSLWLYEVEKEFDEGLGLEFAGAVFDGEKSCANRCVFCFIHQMPQGLRDTLYVQDDDYRLSFWHGNFITLTNVKKNDLERILEMRLSPLYVSVHTTNPDLRRKMLGNRRAGEIMQQLQKLVEAGIDIHTQVVLCPGWNDGEELDRTVRDLDLLGRNLCSVGVVPVGLTGFRDGLPEMRPFSGEEAKDLVAQINTWQKNFRAARGSSFVYLSDEFYLLAGENIPAGKYYDEYPQIENGIGLIRFFTDSFEKNLRKMVQKGHEGRALDMPGQRNRVISVATGTAAGPVLRGLCGRLGGSGLDLRVYAVENRFFGGYVNVAGLLTGKDLYESLKGQELGEKLLLPSVMVKCDEPVFLDGMTVEELSGRLEVEVEIIPVEEGASPFLEALLR